MSAPTLPSRRRRELCQIAEAAGATVQAIGQTRGNHIRIEVTAPKRGRKVFYTAHTASDCRGERNLRASIRRWVANRKESPCVA